MIRAEVIPEVALKALREIADPSLRVGTTLPTDTDTFRAAGLRGLPLEQADWRARLSANLPTIEPDYAKIEVAQRLFATYGTEIAGALLLAVLPQSYATAFGAGVLGANAALENDAVRRIRRTAEFVIVVMAKGEKPEDRKRQWDPDFDPPHPGVPLRPWERCEQLRIYHQAIRDNLKASTNEEAKALLGKENKVPVNQEDLLALQLSLSVTVFEVLERFGIAWTKDEQEAYLHVWDLVGAHLGIGSAAAVSAMDNAVPGPPITNDSWHGLRPPTIDDTRSLLEQLRARQWLDPGPTGPLDTTQWTSARAGRILTKALLDELAAAMPRPLKLLPITIMRALAPELVRKRLSLGANGLVLGALVMLPRSRVMIDRFTGLEVPNRMGSSALRAMSNEVTTRAALRFVRAPDFDIPGLVIGPPPYGT